MFLAVPAAGAAPSMSFAPVVFCLLPRSAPLKVLRLQVLKPMLGMALSPSSLSSIFGCGCSWAQLVGRDRDIDAISTQYRRCASFVGHIVPFVGHLGPYTMIFIL